MTSTTTRLRVTFSVLFVLVVVAAVAGWFAGRPIDELSAVLMWCAAAVGIGEGSNVGKRASWKKEAADAAVQQTVE